MQINVLGTKYTIKEVYPKSDKELEIADGYIIFCNKEITISNLNDWDDSPDKNVYRNKIIRHELINAFLYESGLAFNSTEASNWAMNEEMIDWMAIQMPKIMEAYNEVMNIPMPIYNECSCVDGTKIKIRVDK